jgi:hypothetical protein
MDLKDMILVTENDRGTEINMLMTLDDYKSFIAIDDIWLYSLEVGPVPIIVSHAEDFGC